MRTLISISLIACSFIATPALAQSDSYGTKTTTVQQDTTGNYSANTARNHVDANGNSVNVNTSVKSDPYGNASVSKQVESNSTDANGVSSKTVTHSTSDTNGKEKVVRYQEQSN